MDKENPVTDIQKIFGGIAVKFFPVSVDNFFKEPDDIADFANSLPMESSPIYNFPGKRTKPLSEIDPPFNDAIINKILTIYRLPEDIFCKRGNLYFQKIQSFSDHKDDVINKGWIHKDTVYHPDDDNLVGLIYLNQHIDPDAGTSLFDVVPDIDQHLYQSKNIEVGKYKKQSYTNSVSNEELEEVYESHMKFYVEKLRIQNKYNRMIAYDPNEFHRANSFYTGTEEDRLTLVFFLQLDNVAKWPIDLIREKG
tara:strand:- start:341 stop:1096 length:756 start_codon:yes stop_codon:yes gene_type:complete